MSLEKELAENSSKSEEQMMGEIKKENSRTFEYTYENYVKNYGDWRTEEKMTKEEWEEDHINYINGLIKFWKTKNIKWKLGHINTLKKENQKMQTKINLSL